MNARPLTVDCFRIARNVIGPFVAYSLSLLRLRGNLADDRDKKCGSYLPRTLRMAS